MSDAGRLARTCYLKVRLEWLTSSGRLRTDARLHTGSPLCVLPYALWHDNNLPWQLLGHELLTLGGRPRPEALQWRGAPCYFGETQVRLVDEGNNVSRSLRIIAKLVTKPLSTSWEGIILLGYNFLLDNSLIVNLNPRTRQNTGNVNNVVGFLTVP